MIQAVLKKVFGSRNERLLKQYGRTVREINALEPEISRLTDDQLRARTDELRKRVQDSIARAGVPRLATAGSLAARQAAAGRMLGGRARSDFPAGMDSSAVPAHRAWTMLFLRRAAALSRLL